jgi:hypothetical protein
MFAFHFSARLFQTGKHVWPRASWLSQSFYTGGYKSSKYGRFASAYSTSRSERSQSSRWDFIEGSGERVSGNYGFACSQCRRSTVAERNEFRNEHGKLDELPIGGRRSNTSTVVRFDLDSTCSKDSSTLSRRHRKRILCEWRRTNKGIHYAGALQYMTCLLKKKTVQQREYF